MEHSELVQLMQELKQSRGWKVITDHIQPIIQGAELRLLGDSDMTLEAQKDLKKTWSLYKKFVEYPDFLVARSAAGSAGAEDTTDPYER